MLSDSVATPQMSSGYISACHASIPAPILCWRSRRRWCAGPSPFSLDLSLDLTLDLSLDLTLDLSLDLTLDLSLDLSIDLSLDLLLDLSIDFSLDLSHDLSLDLKLDLSLGSCLGLLKCCLEYGEPGDEVKGAVQSPCSWQWHRSAPALYSVSPLPSRGSARCAALCPKAFRCPKP